MHTAMATQVIMDALGDVLGFYNNGGSKLLTKGLRCQRLGLGCSW